MNRKAVALVVSFIVIASLAVLGTAMLSKSISESRMARRYTESLQAFWLAEAGAEAARQQLNNDWYNTFSSEVILGPGKYNFSIVNTGRDSNPLPFNQYRIISTGTVQNTIREVEIILERVFSDIYKYGLAGVDLIELKQGVTIHGDIYSDGDIEVKAGAAVVKIDDSIMPVDPNAYNADVYYTGSVLGIGGTVEGDLISTTESIPPPDIDFDKLKLDADFVMPSGTILSGAIADGIYYITGDVQVNNVTLNEGAIISEGNMRVSGGFTFDHPKSHAPALANRAGTIEVKDSAEVRGLIYCGGLGIELKSGADITVYGSVVAANENVEIKTFDGETVGEVSVYYKPEYLLGLEENSTEIISWRDPQNPYVIVP